MQCNFLAEGCDGGWSIYVSLFAETFGLVDEMCAPYTGDTNQGKCSDYQHCEIIAKVEKGYPIGGYYGNGSELAMMLDLRKNGPIVADFEPWVTFQLYSEGIYKDNKDQALRQLTEQQKETVLDNEKANQLTMQDY